MQVQGATTDLGYRSWLLGAPCFVLRQYPLKAGERRHCFNLFRPIKRVGQQQNSDVKREITRSLLNHFSSKSFLIFNIHLEMAGDFRLNRNSLAWLFPIDRGKLFCMNLTLTLHPKFRGLTT